MERQHASSCRTDRSDAPVHEVPHRGHRLRGIAGTVQGHSWLVRIKGNLDSLSLTYCEAPGIPEIANHFCHRRIAIDPVRSEEHTSELQSPCNLVCRLLLEKKK